MFEFYVIWDDKEEQEEEEEEDLKFIDLYEKYFHVPFYLTP